MKNPPFYGMGAVDRVRCIAGRCSTTAVVCGSGGCDGRPGPFTQAIAEAMGNPGPDTERLVAGYFNALRESREGIKLDDNQ